MTVHSDFWTHVEDLAWGQRGRAAIETRWGEYWVNIGWLDYETEDLRSGFTAHGPFRTLADALIYTRTAVADHHQSEDGS